MSSGAPEGIGSGMEDVAYWKMKYELLQCEYVQTKARSEELEERMLNLVEHIEIDNQTAEEKIERLTEELALATNKATCLERDCARYKKDCVLAVHLLHCQPSNYVASKTAPDIFAKNEDDSQNISVVRGVSTFPPMAVYLPEDEADDVSGEKTSSGLGGSDLELSTLKPSPSFTAQFIERIKNDEDYSCVELRKCENCSTVVTVMSRETQTPVPQPPRPKIIDMKEDSYVAKGVVHVI